MARLLPHLTPLIDIRNADFGWAGREWSFNEADPHKQRHTDSEFIERLRESISDILSFGDSDDTGMLRSIWHHKGIHVPIS